MSQESLSLNCLFKQLGLNDSNEDIAEFISSHTPIDPDISIHEATFWSTGQADFLKQAISEDSEWAIIVDELSERLRN